MPPTRSPKEKGPEQMRRYMVNFQGPIAKGKTGLTVSFDGNSSYDSRTIVASAPAGSRSTRSRRCRWTR